MDNPTGALELSVILPSFLEEENLRILVPSIQKELDSQAIRYEVLVVDTETPKDGTPQLCAQLKVRYINRSGGNNYADAVRTGIQSANGARTLFMDADGSHPAYFIRSLLHEKNNADIIVASRYTKGGGTENSPMLILMSKMVNFGFSTVLGLKCKDVSNSFKLYRSPLLKSLNLKCNNFDVVEEILFRIMRQNPKCTIKEIPFTFKQRMFGSSKRNLIAFIFTYFFTLLKLRFFSK